MSSCFSREIVFLIFFWKRHVPKAKLFLMIFSGQDCARGGHNHAAAPAVWHSYQCHQCSSCSTTRCFISSSSPSCRWSGGRRGARRGGPGVVSSPAPDPVASYVRQCQKCGEMSYFRERCCLNEKCEAWQVFFLGGLGGWLMTPNEELAWLYHKDLNALKNWAGKPQSPDQWNQKWDSYQQKKPKNRGQSEEG